MVFSRNSGFLTNKTDRHDITEILLKVSLDTITLTLTVSIYKSTFYIAPDVTTHSFNLKKNIKEKLINHR